MMMAMARPARARLIQRAPPPRMTTMLVMVLIGWLDQVIRRIVRREDPCDP
jgi:hypothetical protein